MVDGSERLSIREKIGYGLGDTAANLIFQAMVVFQLSFYTDTFGISAAAAGTLFIVVRVWDAIFDPIMGIIADRTHTRWGKFRPWILWTAVPFGILGMAVFFTPSFGPSGKLAYAYVTYILLMIVYSANNLPYSALTGVMTGDIADRTSLSSYRFVFATMAAFVGQGLSLLMVRFFGKGNNVKGYQITIGILSTLAVVCFLVTFFTIRERIQPDPAQKPDIRRDFRDLAHNGPWFILFVLTVLIFLAYTMRGGVMVYYFKYYLRWEDLFSLFNVGGLAASVAGILLYKPLSMRHGKREVYRAGLFLTVVLQALFLGLPTAPSFAFVVEVLRQLCYGTTIPLLWTMMDDDGRCSRLLGMEDRPACNGDRIFRFGFRTQGWSRLRRRDWRLASPAVRLCS